MVGVPGRSKACATCRKRGKGCNRERPSCAQCRKAGLECAGYDTQRVFVVSTPSSRRIGYTASASPAQPDLSWHRGASPGSGLSSIDDFQLLARPEQERRCIDIFWEAYFPSGRPLPMGVSRSYTCGWTETARALYREDDSLRYAMWANCLFTTGRRNGATWMMEDAFKLYGAALYNLRRSLGASGGVRRDSLIATVKLLSLFEVCCKQEHSAAWSQDWQRHHAGELALFVARTPMAHTQGEAHHIFSDERVELAFSAVLRRKTLVLSTPEWKSIPWREIPKNLKDVLVDVLVEMPGLLEDFDNMQSCKDHARREELRQALIERCWLHDRQILHWFSLVCRKDDPCNKKPKEFKMSDIVQHVAIIHGMSLFWITSLILYSTLRNASGSQDGFTDRTDPKRYALKLVEAIIILNRPSAGLYGKQSAALLLEVGLQYTKTTSSLSEEYELLVDTMKTLKSESSSSSPGEGRPTLGPVVASTAQEAQ